MKKRILIDFVFLLSIISGAFADPVTLETSIRNGISSGLEDFSEALRNSSVILANQQNVYADSFIGKLFPAIPFHLAFGVNTGFAQLDTSGLKDATETFSQGISNTGLSGIDFSVPSSFLLPVITLDVRLGGIIFPFDIGITAMLTNKDAINIDTADENSYLENDSPLNLSYKGFSGCYEFFTVGFDFRYAILEENLIFPGISIGAGYYLSKGAFEVSASKSGVEADVSTAYLTQLLYLQTQISKNFLIVTPFAGLRAVVSSTENSWAWKLSGSTTISGTSYSYQDSDSGSLSRLFKDFYMSPQIYLGAGLNLFILQTTLSATYDLRDYLWAAALNLRIKL